MLKTRLIAAALLVGGAAIGWFVYSSEMQGNPFPFKYGLDLAGGTHLVYSADVSKVAASDIDEAMEALRNVIERRVNIFGVSEPIVQVERGGITGGGDYRLIVELPGITNLSDAVKAIGQTPTLDFRLEESVSSTTATYVATGLSGQYLSRATLQFGSNSSGALSNEPIIVLTFNTEGATRFRDITEKNIGRVLGIFLDDQLISAPVIQEAIPNGTATITGNFTPEGGRELVRNLNFGVVGFRIRRGFSPCLVPSAGTYRHLRPRSLCRPFLDDIQAHPGNPDDGGPCRIHTLYRNGG